MVTAQLMKRGQAMALGAVQRPMILTNVKALGSVQPAQRLRRLQVAADSSAEGVQVTPLSYWPVLSGRLFGKCSLP